MEKILPAAQSDYDNESNNKWYQMLLPKFIRGKKDGK